MSSTLSSKTAVDGRATRWSGQREKRRAEFVEAALEAIAHYGPQASTEQVADHVGVTRTKLYRYFDGAADLHHSIARRASDMLTAKQTLVWDVPLSPMQVITSTVSMHVKWRMQHPNLYEYLTRHPLSDDAHGVAAIHDVNRAVARNLAEVIATFYRTLGVDERPAVPLSIRSGRFCGVLGDSLAQRPGAAAPEGLHHATRRVDVVTAEHRAAESRYSDRPAPTSRAAGVGVSHIASLLPFF